jgi:4-amino-4-deoxy-L-arabinose transferase-like glycosyltransferase
MSERRVNRHWRWLLAVIVAVYLTLALGRALSSQPWNDEAWYTSPSWNLIHHGSTGTPIIETTGKFWKGMDRITYWVVPLEFFVQVPWIKVFGFGLVTMRLFAISWGLIALQACTRIVFLLTGNILAALSTALLLACDYQFASQTALARMDAMAVALATLAILAYLELRQTRFTEAIALSQAAVVACGLTHPTAGVPVFVAVLVLTVTLDIKRVRLSHLAVAVVPYLLGATFWGWYISYAPDLFRAQFLGNVTDIDRLGGFAHPLQAIQREFGRYMGMSGFGFALSPLYQIKLIAILTYFVAVIGLFANSDLRSREGTRTLLVLWSVYFLSLTFYDNTKEVKYAIHIVPLYDAVLGVWIAYSLMKKGAQRLLAAGCGVGFIIVSVGGLAYTSLMKDDYHQTYLPTAEFLKQEAAPSDLIMASSSFGFALGFDRNIVDDNDFTYKTHKRPVFIVINNGYRGVLLHNQIAHPEIVAYFNDLLLHKYQLVFTQGEYQVFESKEKLSGQRNGITAQ